MLTLCNSCFHQYQIAGYIAFTSVGWVWTRTNPYVLVCETNSKLKTCDLIGHVICWCWKHQHCLFWLKYSSMWSELYMSLVRSMSVDSVRLECWDCWVTSWDSVFLFFSIHPLNMLLGCTFASGSSTVMPEWLTCGTSSTCQSRCREVRCTFMFVTLFFYLF
jgi:hypothetical protein